MKENQNNMRFMLRKYVSDYFGIITNKTEEQGSFLIAYRSRKEQFCC